MKGLLLKDIYNTVNQYKSMAIIIAVTPLFTFSIGLHGYGFYIIFVAMITALMVLNTMTYDETSKWDKFAFVTVVDKKDIVGSKYILTYFLLISGTLSIVIVNLLNHIIRKEELSFSIVFIPLIIWGATSLFTSILIPLIYKLGAENSIFALLISVVLAILCVAIGFLIIDRIITLGVLGVLGMSLGDDIFIAVVVTATAFVLLLILALISYKTSIAIFKKKDV